MDIVCAQPHRYRHGMNIPRGETLNSWESRTKKPAAACSHLCACIRDALPKRQLASQHAHRPRCFFRSPRFHSKTSRGMDARSETASFSRFASARLNISLKERSQPDRRDTGMILQPCRASWRGAKKKEEEKDDYGLHGRQLASSQPVSHQMIDWLCRFGTKKRRKNKKREKKRLRKKQNKVVCAGAWPNGVPLTAT